MNYERFELPNGLRVLAAPMPSMRSATCAVFVGVGSRWESDQQAGAAHLIEHLLFKGTRKRPSSRAISETLERVGGMINASTDKETTVYWTKTASDHVELSLDLLADMLLNSRLTPKNVERERSIIVEELGMSMDDPQDWVHGLIDQVMWPHHPLGRDIAGTKQSVMGLKRSQVRSIMSTFYGANNALLVVAGGINPSHIWRMAERLFGTWSRVQPPHFDDANSFHAEGRIDLQRRPTEQLHLCLAFPGLSRFDPDRYALDLLATILGGSTTSRLFLEVRERRALAYEIHMYTNKLADTGSVVVYAGVDPARAVEAVTAVVREIDRLRRRAVTPDELQKTLDYVKGRLYLGLEDTHAVASWLGSQEMLMGRIESPEEVLARVEKVTTAEIRRVANDLFGPEKMRLAAIGPNAETVAQSLAV